MMLSGSPARGSHKPPSRKQATTRQGDGLEECPPGRGQRNGSVGQHSNPNSEARNSKQYQMTKIQTTKTNKLLEAYQPYLAPFGALEHLWFGFVSDFGIRVSNLSSETQLVTGSS
jgi:hypothetical protein